jgi:hypothetical protein
VTADAHRVTDLAALGILYGTVNEASRVKETRTLTPAYRAFVEASPFLVIASAGPEGLDCSPRGDAGAVAAVVDARTLALPDRRGNNRLDTLRNIVADPRVALLFFAPGATETLRVNGMASISTDSELRARFVVEGKEPATVLLVAIEAVYFQCARALKRARLWEPGAQPGRAPSAGAMLRDASPDFDAEAYDAALSRRQAESLY